MAKSKSYDCVVVGASLAGLVVASKLLEKKKSVLILEGSAQIGARLFKAPFCEQSLDYRLKLTAHSEDTANCLKSLEDMGHSVPLRAVDDEIKSYDGLKPTAFLGFGENPPDYYEQINEFLKEKSFSADFSEVLASLEAKIVELGGEIQTKSSATGYFVEQGQIQSVEINGGKKIKTQAVVHAAHPRQLNQLLPLEAMSTKVRQKLGKHKSWSAIGIDCLFKKDECLDVSGRVLFPGTKNENHPTIAHFSRRGDQLIGQFLTFVEGQAESDGEIGGTAVRRIRKQLKKYLPEVFQVVEKERVTVSAESHGLVDLKLTEDHRLPGLFNCAVLHGSLFSQSDFPFELSVASSICDSLLQNSSSDETLLSESSTDESPSLEPAEDPVAENPVAQEFNI